MEHKAGSSTEIRTADIVRIYHNDTAKTFSFWGLVESNLGNLQALAMQKVFATGNYGTGQALVYDHSVFILSNTDESLDSAVTGAGVGGTDSTFDGSVSTHHFSSDLTVSTSGTPGFTVAAAVVGTPTTLDNYGCINFTTPNVDAGPADAACSALPTPAAPDSPPFLAPSGTWNLATLVAAGATVEHVSGY